MDIVNYRVTVTQPDGNDHVSLFQTEELAQHYAHDMGSGSLANWPTKVEERRFTLEVGDIVQVFDAGRSVMFTGRIRGFADPAKRSALFPINVTTISRRQWWGPWEILAIIETKGANDNG